MLDTIHLHGCLLFLAINCCIGLIFIAFMKETRGQSLDSINSTGNQLSAHKDNNWHGHWLYLNLKKKTCVFFGVIISILKYWTSWKRTFFKTKTAQNSFLFYLQNYFVKPILEIKTNKKIRWTTELYFEKKTFYLCSCSAIFWTLFLLTFLSTSLSMTFIAQLTEVFVSMTLHVFDNKCDWNLQNNNICDEKMCIFLRINRDLM